jgi:hypothetical protein
MSIEVDVLCETYSIIKEYVSSKDRQAAADHLFSVLTDLEISEKDLKIFSQTDQYLQRSCSEYFQDDGDADSEDEDEYDYGRDD